LDRLTEEDKIPDMPTKLEKPLDLQFEKQIKEYEQEILNKQKKISEIKEKIDAEKFGANPERKNLLDKKNKLIEAIRPLNHEIKSLDLELHQVKNDINWYKNEKDHLKKEIENWSLEQLLSEIKHLKEKIGFAQMSVTEEKKTIERKLKLEAMIPKVKKFKEYNDALNQIYKENNESLTKIKTLKEKRNKMSEEIDSIDIKVDLINQSKVSNKPAVTQLEKEKYEVEDEIKSLQEKKFGKRIKTGMIVGITITIILLR